ncbi:hypothetical protein Godav_027579, partial [Gossypium davidsonii]|nr:hypothetical protein [Gossypium davidsonii]
GLVKIEKELANLNIEDGDDECGAIFGNKEHNDKSLASIGRSSNLRCGWEAEEEDPMEVPLVSSAFWIQVHDLPSRNTRRASMMNIVWLREEDDANWGNNGCKIQANNANASPSNEMDRANMEDSPIENDDGKKRPKFDN